MTRFHRMIVFLVLVALVAACGPATIQPAPPVARPAISSATSQPVTSVLPDVQIERHPSPVDYSRFFADISSIPRFDLASDNPFQVDLRSRDLSALDISTSKDDLLYADFDSKTIWPPAEKMPADFDWQKIMELGKDPGLGVRALHDQGITGKGIGIAIIDQTLLVDHVEYKDRIRLYEEADDITGGWLEVQMHGPAVASIAVGKTIGVAPEADLYYIAVGDCGGAQSIKDLDFACQAKAIRRVIEINKTLPADRKIRVVSMSIGWAPGNKSYDDIMAAVEEAKSAGLFVISTSISRTYGLNFHGLGRDPLSDPNQSGSYVPGLWWQNNFYKNGTLANTLLVPMDARTTASPTGLEDYVFYREGGWSWCVPYLSGMYALSAQVKHDITPQEFWDTALKTGQTIQIQHDGKDHKFGVILDPQALIESLQAN